MAPRGDGRERERLLVGTARPVGSLTLETLAGTGGETMEVAGVVSTGPVRVPALAAVAIALCVGVTVVFGFWPGPLTSFAHHATLLFLP